ncbi:hypothetical protein AAZX31_17G187700 [Glycine max]
MYSCSTHTHLLVVAVVLVDNHNFAVLNKLIGLST